MVLFLQSSATTRKQGLLPSADQLHLQVSPSPDCEPYYARLSAQHRLPHFFLLQTPANNKLLSFYRGGN